MTAKPVTAEEADSLFDRLSGHAAVLLAVSGGPDSMALLVLAARWRARRERGPKLVVATVDHGLRKEGRVEAAAVARQCRQLGLTHRTLRWTGKKPKTGLQQAARDARYRLLAQTARRVRATAIVTAHTLDDQAETVLIRLTRGSGLTGLCGMRFHGTVPGHEDIALERPLLGLAKARLLATLAAEGVVYAQDPSNSDPRFTRARLRESMPVLAGEGLTAARLALLSRRLQRADDAIQLMTDAAEDLMVLSSGPGTVAYDLVRFVATPDEALVRLLGRTIARVGTEGTVELAKLEALLDAILLALSAQKSANGRFRRTLAGALVTLTRDRIVIERAPPRRGSVLTTVGRGSVRPGKRRYNK